MFAVSTNILQRTFQVQHDGMQGTAYTFEKGDQQYLISAAHIFDGSPDLNSISIFHDERWKIVPVRTVYSSYGPADTIVFALPRDISARLPIKFDLSGVITGTWAYFLGFPRGLRTRAPKSINNGYPLPFVKAGLVSSIDFESHGYSRIYLDGHNNKGFSGGPIVWAPPNNPNDLRIIGTNVCYVTEHPTSKETAEEVVDYQTNAGIVVAIWIKDLLRQLA